ncbi:conserved membrane hypothetical protein [Frankia canadensis]|uniref:Integral membrane protein n=1 Tax=Frankia canadensis TaxID=1836972 RepID=A0A2I2KSX6_9ACTN|nr:hypothetical protein [Frankia canadensis]SNQ48783.1 conserved membrane hypothetical protein [Frankia canadensis]SOU56073.1 conserved membrane hypothetical protein [Frankia canadensis]
MSGTRTSSGPGRILVTVYAIFAVAACSRSAVQIATEFDHARLAYLLSAFAAVVYVVATVALTRPGARWHRVAVAACATELAGVLAVGTASVVDSSAFPDQAVWSSYGSGYLFIPVVLPVLGLAWLRRTAARPDPSGDLNGDTSGAGIS